MNKNIGIIGCGAILPRHLESIDLNKNFNLVAICDIQESTSTEIAKKLGVESYTNYKKMIDSGKVNFITIATPNSLHHEQAIYGLKNGCDVLIEKPVSFSEEEIYDIMNTAKLNNREAYCVL